MRLNTVGTCQAGGGPDDAAQLNRCRDEKVDIGMPGRDGTAQTARDGRRGMIIYGYKFPPDHARQACLSFGPCTIVYRVTATLAVGKWLFVLWQAL